MKRRRLGGFGAALAVTCPLLLVASAPAGAAGSSGFSLGDAARYGEYAGGTTSVIGETVGGAAAYGGSAMIATSKFGSSAWSHHDPRGVILALGGSTNSVNTTAVFHGRGEYVGSFSGSGNFGTFTHVSSLPISFPTADSDLAAASSGIAGLGATNTATGTSALSLTSSFPGTDVFELTEAQLTGASTISIHAPRRAVVVVNVTGGAGLTLSNQKVSLSGGVTADDVLWNFPSVPSASFSLESWVGTILIPTGTLSMSTNWLFGSVLFGGSTASFYKDVVFVALFSGCISYDPGTGTPEAPAAIALPGVALVAFGGMLLARRRTRNRVRPTPA
jgi:choice-of-anchor A domain-containing protein